MSSSSQAAMKRSLDGSKTRRRTILLILAALAPSALFAGLVHLVLIATHRSEPAAATVYGVTAPRVWATIVAALALASVLAGSVALARPAKRVAALIAVPGGVIAAING